MKQFTCLLLEKALGQRQPPSCAPEASSASCALPAVEVSSHFSTKRLFLVFLLPSLLAAARSLVGLWIHLLFLLWPLHVFDTLLPVIQILIH